MTSAEFLDTNQNQLILLHLSAFFWRGTPSSHLSVRTSYVQEPPGNIFCKGTKKCLGMFPESGLRAF